MQVAINENKEAPYFNILNTDSNDEQNNFDLAKLINEVSEEELVVAASQVEKEYQKDPSFQKETTTTTVMKKSDVRGPNIGQGTSFNGCKIANIHFHIHKN